MASAASSNRRIRSLLEKFNLKITSQKTPTAIRAAGGFEPSTGPLFQRLVAPREIQSSGYRPQQGPPRDAPIQPGAGFGRLIDPQADWRTPPRMIALPGWTGLPGHGIQTE